MKKKIQEVKLPEGYLQDWQLTFKLTDSLQKAKVSTPINVEALMEIQKAAAYALFEYENNLLAEKGQKTTGEYENPFLQWVLCSLELFQFILPRKTRAEFYEPAYNDLKADYLIAKKYRSLVAKAWLTFCFGFRATSMIVECFGLMGGKKLKALFWILLPEALRRIWRAHF